ncbi:hypothetical protein IC757_14665 [Wenzhouxiangella sp. AB-CW3]|uniref:hypothetical protein n=1 Tax=Wenzhouxiangella sp. AB-CW3 TaxID=2771012 RepID=UPI00168B8A68|nr:hypothetical protein [Wenzhouxiangella sp. AB-CW3]QOC22242.1 hypothetical protein IC757_14665 [Wenzhouxiangella sp. AB-CW3]
MLIDQAQAIKCIDERASMLSIAKSITRSRWVFVNVANSDRDIAIIWGTRHKLGGLMQPELHKLLFLAKVYTIRKLEAPDDNRDVLQVSSVKATLQIVKVFLLWAAGEGIRDPKNISEKLCERFLRTRGQNNERPSTAYLDAIVAVLSDLHNTSQDFGIPFGVRPKSIIKLQNQVSSLGRVKGCAVESIERPLAKEMIAFSKEVVEEGAKLLPIWIRCQDIADMEYAKGSSTCVVRDRIHKYLQRTCSGKRLLLPNSFIPFKLNSTGWLARNIRLINAGAVTLIMMLTGMRPSEFVDLRTNCIVYIKHSDGVKYPYVKGKIIKYGRRDHYWPAIELLVSSVDTIKRLQSHRRSPESNYLFVGLGGRGAFFDKRREPGRRFAAPEKIGPVMQTVADEVVSRNNGLMRGSVNPRLARKTFAQFVATRDKAGLDSISTLYGHIDYRMTDDSYVGSDFELQALIAGYAEEELLSEIASLVKNGEIVSGSVFSGMVFQGEVEQEQVIEHLRNQGVSIHACEWGYCLFIKELAKCKGDSGPDDRLRSPEICAGCSNNIRTQETLDWWRRTRGRDKELLARGGIPTQTVEMLRERIATADRVLNSEG